MENEAVKVKSKYNKKGDHQDRFVKKCAEWVALNNRPFRIVENAGFRSLMDEVAPRYNPVAAKSLVMPLEDLHKKVENELDASLLRAAAVSITRGLWTDSTGSSYASVTVHYIDSEWSICSLLLACTQLHGKHTGSELAKFLIATAQRYSILQNVVSVSVDNASNAKSQVEMSAEQGSLLFEIAAEGEEEGSPNFILGDISPASEEDGVNGIEPLLGER